MLIICEPTFKPVNKDNESEEEIFYTVDKAQNQKYLRAEIVATLSDLFPDKVGDIETLGKSVYGITFFDADNFDDEIQILNEYNAQKHNFEVKYKDNIINTTLELFTFMIKNKESFPKEIVLTEEQVAQIQDNIHTDLSGLKNLESIFLVSADVSGVNFNGSTIRNSTFSETNFFATQFTDTTINNTNFTEADIRYAQFEVSTLTKVNFYKADLRHANFAGSTLTDVDLRDADLRYTDLSSVTFAGKCKMAGAQFVNITNVLENLYEYPPNLFDDVINTEEDEYEDGEGEGEGDGDEDESAFLKTNAAIFSSANVKAGDEQAEAEDDDDDDDDVNTNPPICADVINGYDINIPAYLARNDANFTIQLPNSDKYECVNLNDIKRYHIKTDKAGMKYFNYYYACNDETPYYAFTEENYIRAQAYIRMGSFSLLVEKPDWFPQAEMPIYRKFKLVKTGTKPAFVSETMLRHGEQGDADYISSEWHCNAGKMDTYKLEPIMEGGRTYKKIKPSKKTQRKNMMKKRTQRKNMIKKMIHKKKNKKTQNKKKNKKTRKL
jgi:uncharacterized protein YjbI with pentapeptide repeats